MGQLINSRLISIHIVWHFVFIFYWHPYLHKLGVEEVTLAMWINEAINKRNSVEFVLIS